MFIPPPTPVLSKAEIDARRSRYEANQARHLSSGSSGVHSDSSSERKLSTTEPSTPDTTTTLIRKINIFGLNKEDKKNRATLEISAPILSPVTTNDKHRDSSSVVASPAAYSPASPPRRPPRPSGHLSFESALISPVYQSPRVSSIRSRHSNDSDSMERRSPASAHSSPLMDRFRRTGSNHSAQSIASSASSQALLAGVQSGRIGKGVSRRGNSTTSSIDEESNALKELVQSRKPKKPKSKSNVSARHKHTSSLEAALLGLGGVPEQPKRVPPKLSIHATPYIPAHQRSIEADYQERALPATPESICKTPTELYQSSTWPLADASRASVAAKTVMKPHVLASPSRLSAIPEHRLRYRQSPAHSGVSTPTKTKIHLRGGSVVTVTPPELNAWKRTVYIQGPIKLTKPAIIPRKNSLASLEPFQEVVEQLYQESLRGSRRHSDEAAAKEICDFFIHFGICDVYPRSDTVDVTECGLSEEELGSDTDLEVPDSPEWSTAVVPKVAAMPVLDLPPVETAEALRKRGIARLKGKDAVRKADSLLTLVPLPEDNILDAVLASAVRYNDRDQDHHKVKEAGGTEDEVDSSAPWISSGNMHRRAAVPKRYSQ